MGETHQNCCSHTTGEIYPLPVLLHTIIMVLLLYFHLQCDSGQDFITVLSKASFSIHVLKTILSVKNIKVESR